MSDIIIMSKHENIKNSEHLINHVISDCRFALCYTCRNGNFYVTEGKSEEIGSDTLFMGTFFCSVLLEKFIACSADYTNNNIHRGNHPVYCEQYDDKSKPSKIEQLTAMVEKNLK